MPRPGRQPFPQHGNPDGRLSVVPVLQATCLLLLGALVLGACALRLVHLAEAALEPVPGDMLRLASGGHAFGSVPAVVRAAGDLKPGARCTLGTGADAAQGGSVLVIGRTAEGDLLVQWAGPGRSAASGTDCGRSAELLLTPDDFDTLRGEGTEGRTAAAAMM